MVSDELLRNCFTCLAADAITLGCGPPTPKPSAEENRFLYKLQLAFKQGQILVCNESSPVGAIDHDCKMLPHCDHTDVLASLFSKECIEGKL